MSSNHVSVPENLAPAALRHSLSDAIRSGRVLWTRVDGLSAADPRVHTALQSTLRRTGLHGDWGGKPELVVLDWTHFVTISADGLAFAAVLCQSLRQRGITVLCLPAEAPDVSATLADPACAALRENGVDWRPGPRGTLAASASYILVGSLRLFAGWGGANLTPTFDEIVDALERGGWPNVPELDALLMEMAQNVFSHARADHASLSVVVHRRRRPPRLQVGMADDGVGIPNAMLADPRHAWLESYSPARATATVVTRQLTGRGPGEAGGVLGDLYDRLLTEAGATITLRSREGWVQITGSPRSIRHESMTYGLGTQVLVELPLVGR